MSQNCDLILPSLYNGSGYDHGTDREVRKDQLFQELESSKPTPKESFMGFQEAEILSFPVYLLPEAGKRTSKGASVTKECQTNTAEDLEDQQFSKLNLQRFLPTSLSKKNPFIEIGNRTWPYLNNGSGYDHERDTEEVRKDQLFQKLESRSLMLEESFRRFQEKYPENLTKPQSPDGRRPNMSNGKMMQDIGESFSGNKFLGKGSFNRMKYTHELVLEETLGLCDTSQSKEELSKIRKYVNMREMLQHQAWINVVPQGGHI